MGRFYARVLASITAAAIALWASAAAADARPVVVASTNFTEQLILANIYTDVLEGHGVAVKKRLNLGSREVVFPALKAGEIDVLPEYTGALLAYLSNGQSRVRAPKKVLAALRAALPDSIVALAPSSAQDRDGLVVTGQTADTYHLDSISDLQPVASKLTLGGPPEMKTRYVGLEGLKQVYGIAFSRFRALDAGGPLTQAALQSGAIDVARMFSTQGVIRARGWVLLKDDKNLVAAQNLIPVARRAVITPRIRRLLDRISTALSTEQLQAMNKQVTVAKKDPATIAANWVSRHGLGGGSRD